MFVTATGAAMEGRTFIRKWFRPLLLHAGLPPIRLHDLRHTYASVALARGIRAKVVQEAMGHTIGEWCSGVRFIYEREIFHRVRT